MARGRLNEVLMMLSVGFLCCPGTPLYAAHFRPGQFVDITAKTQVLLLFSFCYFLLFFSLPLSSFLASFSSILLRSPLSLLSLPLAISPSLSSPLCSPLLSSLLLLFSPLFPSTPILSFFPLIFSSTLVLPRGVLRWLANDN